MRRSIQVMALSLSAAAWWALSAAPAFADSDLPDKETAERASTIMIMAGGIVVVVVVIIAVAAIVYLRRATQYRSDEDDS